ncbi:hypothetical protein KC901_00680 [Patescibacteria group bacterium]|nr:hypothetical protein [Patescibacteria group bacterium]
MLVSTLTTAQKSVNTIVLDGTQERIDLLETAYTGYFKANGIFDFTIKKIPSAGYKDGTWVKVSYPYAGESRIIQNSGTLVSDLQKEVEKKDSNVPYNTLIYKYCKEQNKDLVYIADLVIENIKKQPIELPKLEDGDFTGSFTRNNVQFGNQTFDNIDLTGYVDVDTKTIPKQTVSFGRVPITWRPVTYKILGWQDRMTPILSVIVDGIVVGLIVGTIGDLVTDGNIDFDWSPNTDPMNPNIDDGPFNPNDSGQEFVFQTTFRF